MTVVIMVEVRIEEMFRSDCSRPKDYRRAVVINDGTKEHDEQRPLCEVNGEVRLKKI